VDCGHLRASWSDERRAPHGTGRGADARVLEGLNGADLGGPAADDRESFPWLWLGKACGCLGLAVPAPRKSFPWLGARKNEPLRARSLLPLFY